ncbi:MAG: T9SS type A sorting domain-containing protein [Bacteroidota bacterium]|nr:T9SS type A sorting domain-containing protein [Bacteroidota bacterium]
MSFTIGFMISVYPNPSSGKYEVFIDGINDSEVPMKVISFDGREVWSASRTFSGSGRLDLDLSTQSDGIYFLIIETENGILSKKLLKK